MAKETLKNLFIVFLISITPFLNFISKNIGQLYFFDFLYLFIYFLIFVLLIYSLNLFAFKFSKKFDGIFLIGYVVIVFFSYNFIFNLIDKTNLDVFVNQRIMALFLWFALLLLTFIFVKNILHKKIFRKFSLFVFIFLNVSFLISILIGSPTIERQTLRSNQYNMQNLNIQFQNNLEIKPNVYYLLLDHYPRFDILKEFFGYDNSDFLKEIKKKGYKVAEKSISNAMGTDTNMTVVFDMNTEYIKKYLEEKKTFYIGDWLRGRTTVNNIFKKIGYKNFVSIDNTIQGAPCNKLNPKNTGFDKCISQNIQLTELEINFLKATPIIDLIGKFFPTFFAYQYLYLDTITSQLNKLITNNYSLDFSDNEYKKESFFLYIHLLMPHPPPKFDKNCQKKIDIFELNVTHKFESEIAKKSFIEDLKCINKDVLKFIKEINSLDSNSIVVIQSDNSIPTLEFPLSHYNINFWKLPPQCEHMFKNDISNVNTFRIIFNCLGAGNWDLKENELIAIPPELLPN